MTHTASTNAPAWSVNPCVWNEAASLSEALGIPQAAAMVLAGRGLSDPVLAREFLECSIPIPDPFLFADMRAAVSEVVNAVEQKHKIVVHGDYDADGITATALLTLGLGRLGGQVEWYLPSRFREGYGLSAAAVQAIAADSASLLITVDCGVNYPEEVALATRLGLKVVVVDHHEPGPVLPDCHLIHHVRGDYPHTELCGVGLALKLLHALHVSRGDGNSERLPPELAEMLDLVAIGTVADLAGLQGENRMYVRDGIKLLNLGRRVGLRALAEVSGCAGAIDSGTIAFRLAPRLNAAGRLEDPSPPLRLLLTDDEVEARRLAGQLHDLNSARQDIERSMVETAAEQAGASETPPRVLVLASPGWHEGVVGIVASRIVEQYHRPAVLLSIRDGVAKGSGRSIPAYDLLAGLTACSHLLTIFGGHAQAAGLTLPVENLDEFRIALEQHAQSNLSPEDLVPRYRADAVLTSEEINADTATALTALEPYGSGNPRPRFMLVDTQFENVEKTRDGHHLRCQARVGGVIVPAIGFGLARQGVTLPEGRACLAGVQLRADEWRGCVRTQLVLEKVAAVEELASTSAIPCPVRADCVLPRSQTPEGVGLVSPARLERRGGRDWPATARDLRGHAGKVTSLAQVLATQETVTLVTASAHAAAVLLESHLPAVIFGGAAVEFLDNALSVRGNQGNGSQVDVVEWDALSELEAVLRGRTHLVALAPAYRDEHLKVVSELCALGSHVHLMYGDTERAETVRALRLIVHPRFAMVCTYRAMQQGAQGQSEVLATARRIAWDMERVTLGDGLLMRARQVLDELGVGCAHQGKAKLDARQNPSYEQAVAEYEECVALCETL